MIKNGYPLFLKEFKAYFYSPMGYIFLIIFIFCSGFLTFEPGRGSFFYARQADLSPFFYYIPWIFLFLVPAICMRIWAEEKKSGTIELIMTLPLDTGTAVMSKFFASWLFLGLSLLLTFPMVLTVIYLGNPDLKVIFSGYAVSFLMGGVLTAICNFFSAVSKNQVISFILSLLACTLFLMAGSPPVLEFVSAFFPNYFVSLIESLSVLTRFENMERGLWSLGDLWFWFGMMFFWLFATKIILTEKIG